MIATCPACAHGSEIGEGLAPAECILRCNECGSRIAFGRALFHEVVEPFTDDQGRSWIRTRFQDPKTRRDVFVADRDPQLALGIVKSMLALVNA